MAGVILRVGAFAIQVLATPVHTNERVSYLLGDRVFTGGALLSRGWQDGNTGTLYDSSTRVLFAHPNATLVHPTH